MNTSITFATPSWLVKTVFISAVFTSFSCLSVDFETLRKTYSQPSHLWPKADVDESVNADEIGLLPKVIFPKENPFQLQKLQLGQRLFHDGALSRSKQIACASCHDRDLGWADGRRTSFGHDRQKGRRNAPTVENVAFGDTFFWDGRAKTLEQQALMPIQEPLEMNFTLPELVARLAQDSEYLELFKSAYGNEDISSEKISMALATYQRTLTSRRSDFDRFLLASKQKTARIQNVYRAAMSDNAIWGLHLFRTKARCMNCHYGATFSDQKFHNLGLTYYKREYQDLGRYKDTKNPDDIGKFKTPGLRGVTNTKPWMHNGLFGDLTGLLSFYNAGGVNIKKDQSDPLSPETSTLLKPLSLTNKEVAALIEFLQAISAPPALGIVNH